MSKYKLIVFILITAVLASGRAYCQEAMKARQISTITGKVTYMDAENGVVNVQTDKGDMVFYILVESYLFEGTRPMASIEIAKGDPVTIKYDSSSGKNNIVSLVDGKTNDL